MSLSCFLFNDVTINALFYHADYYMYRHVYIYGYPNSTAGLGFLKLGSFGSEIVQLHGCFIFAEMFST